MGVFKKSLQTLLLISVGLFIVAAPVYGATLRFGETYTLSAEETVNDNLYAAAGTVVITGPARGDVLLASGDATVSGDVSGDVFLVAGSAQMLGNVSGDVRVAAGKLTVTDVIGGEAVLLGGVVSFVPHGSVRGDIILVGGKVALFGEVGDDAYIAGGDVSIDGKVIGNVKAYASKKIYIGPNAVIGGDFNYRAPERAVVDAGAVIKGKINFEYINPVLTATDTRGFFAGLFGVAFVIRLLILLAATLLLVLTFRRMSGELARLSVSQFWRSLLVGFLVLVSVPVASVIIALTVFGVLIAALTTMIWLSLLLVAQVYAGIVFAAVLQKRLLRKELQPVLSWKVAALGTLGLGIACLVPYAGPLAYLIFMLSALGTLSELAYRHFILSR